MDKLKLHTPNLVAENVERMAELFPGCVTEARDEATGKVTRKIDFDLLRQELADHVVDGPRERYHLDWPGKREALLAANAPIAKTLRPCREESVDFDTTKNLFIEGDNLEALKLLQETYLAKVKVIYIDPPYNTGRDFVYADDFAQDLSQFLAATAQSDEIGRRMVVNTETNGRFHSSWLSMMYSRIKLARNLLSDDGVMFISIDDGEVGNLRKICDEVFGAANMVANIVWQSKDTPGNDSSSVAQTHNHVLAYARSNSFEPNLLERNEKQLATYKNPDDDPRGAWLGSPLTRGEFRERDYYPLTNPAGEEVYPPAGTCWRRPREVLEELSNDNRIWWGQEGRATFPMEKKFLSEAKGGVVNQTWWPYEFAGSTRNAIAEIKDLFDGRRVFETPKPVQLLKRIIALASRQDSLIVDFFAGSATTAHAVYELNAEDGGWRRFLLIQLAEATAPETETHKAGLTTIAELAKERTRRADSVFRDSMSARSSAGFRVLKIDSSNVKDVDRAPEVTKQDDLLSWTDNIKLDRTPEDLLFHVLVDWGLDLALPIERTSIAGKSVFFVDGNALAACFEQNVSEDLVKEIAKRKPLRAVFRDSSFASDSAKINVEQIFKLLSPTTEVKSL